jgi:hypothetical protein
VRVVSTVPTEDWCVNETAVEPFDTLHGCSIASIVGAGRVDGEKSKLYTASR